MPFVVKWLPQDTAAVVTDSHLFDHLRDELNHACATLKQRPTDIWVEDETDKRIAYQQRIIEHCKSRFPQIATTDDRPHKSSITRGSFPLVLTLVGEVRDRR